MGENTLSWRLRSMAPEDAVQVTGWRYPAPYDLYDWEGDDPQELLDGSTLACVDGTGKLVGFLCFGPGAAIPTEEEVYGSGYLDVGLGLRPDLCGKSLGRGFLSLGLAWARENLGAKRFRLSVARFNRRAQKVYLACGFQETAQVVHSRTGMPFVLMTLEAP